MDNRFQDNIDVFCKRTLFCTILGYTLSFLVTLVFALVIRQSDNIDNRDLLLLSGSTIITTFIPLCVYLIGIQQYKTPSTEPTFQINSQKAIVLLIIVFGIIQILAVVSSFIIDSFFRYFGLVLTNSVNELISTADFRSELIIVGIFLPIMEEIIFRYTLMRRLRHLGIGCSVTLTATAFTFFHANVYQSFYCFVFGLILGYIAFRTNSIKLSALFHIIINSYSVCISFATSSSVILLLKAVKYGCCFAVIPLLFINRKWLKDCFSWDTRTGSCIKNRYYLSLLFFCFFLSVVSATTLSQ